MEICVETDIESTSIKSFSTEESNITSFESFSKHIGKLEEPKTIEKFANLLKKCKLKKLPKILIFIFLNSQKIRKAIRNYVKRDINQLQDNEISII